MSHRPIGIFDSGIGGLTVLRKIEALLPHENLIYFGDTARVPYGTKSPRTIREFALQVSLLLMKQDVKCIVAACNTVSALALDFLRDTFKVPFIGVIDPGVRAALQATRTGSIGVIGTAATIREHLYAHLLTGYDHHITVREQACPLLVPLAEEGILTGPLVEQTLALYFPPLQEASIDTLILGCTHYPLLQDAMQRYLGDGVTMVDSAGATAEALQTLLREEELTNTTESRGTVTFSLSDIHPHFARLTEQFLGRRVEKVEILQADNPEHYLG